MAVETWNGVSLELWAKTLLIRETEERFLRLFSEGKLFGTVHTCIGQEYTAVAVAEALQPGDLIFSNHRCHGHYLARTGDVEGLTAEIMGRATGLCGGRGGSQHLCAAGFFSNGVQGGIVPVAAGLALAEELAGTSNLAAVFIGDGTLGEGVVYETLNIASKWALPLLVVLENNGYAQSTSQRETLAGELDARAEAFGIRAGRCELWDIPQLLARAEAAAAYVRRERKPFFLRVDTYRLMAHSKGDDDRDPAEVAAYRAKDPLGRFAAEHPEDAARLQREASALVDRAVAKAEAAPYAEAGPHDADPPAWRAVRWQPTTFQAHDRVVGRLHDALRNHLLQNEKLVLLGEDIAGPYGGAFKVTRQLSLEFPGRVRNTPISEAALVGLGNGLALNGWLPVCEIMFGDFLTLAFDQFLNHAAKFRYMYNEQVKVPLVIRTPMGGRRGYGATHSQSLEKHWLGVPHTRVLALHHRFDPYELVDRLLSNADRPTLLIENKLLYGLKTDAPPPRGFVVEHSDETFPTTRLRPLTEPDLVIFCYGGLLPEAEQAADRLFEEHDLAAEIVCPACLYPFNAAPLEESLRRTGKLLIVEEGQGFAALGAEVLAQLAERGAAPARVRRLAAPAHPIPSSGPLEKALLPGAAQLVETAAGMCADA
ncbi:MAG: thiamine pyrophosphate-dependent enzyme [Planctomycetota bacterium]|nr:thiamine pyrophosphate-dependent enzyme [Planctomycetota bacterium]